MACGFELEPCVTAAKALYRDWMAHPDTNVIDPDVKGVVYCYGVSSGGYDEWNFAFKMYEKVVDIEERESLIKALTCTKHPWIINILLSESKSDISLFSYVLSLLSVNPIGRSVAWNYYRANYDHRISSFSSSGYSIEQLTSYFNTEMELSEVSNFLAAHITELDITRSDIDNILSKIRFNIKWTKANINPIQTWLGHLTN
ncbi:aminopeptidase N-like [Physella acuta]|uniref:aminopeptidase N-like n=1 Tax=Physella acuta TaxID=109671 RepID=UPI0027DB9CCE|nr:aminopeptidase N-like [Physella acuta]